ncbi:hypothetical protein MJO29_011105 [Puccinia striiformis f. sp. tritici]|nr:hypothetical protein MJO29_011105 [Puccinia striiformis f. sp. tritici]
MSSSSSTNSRTAATAATATVATYTDKLSEKINEEFKEFNKTIQSIHANSAEPIQEIIKLIQDNNKRTLELFQESIQKLFKDLLDSVHTHFSLDRNQEQIKQIDNQIISNTLNADSETRIRLQSILIQQKQELVNQRNQLKHHLQHLPTINNNIGQHSDPNIHPNLQTTTRSPILNNSKRKQIEPEQSTSTSTTSSAKLTTPTVTATATSTSTLEYDEALLDEFSIPDNLSYSQYLQRSQHRTLNLHHSISLNPVQPSTMSSSALDISVQPVTTTNGTGSTTPTQDSSTTAATTPLHSFLPNPALLENYFKPCPSSSKSSRRQSAILRNLVSAALGKLISHVTNNQQMHWPGSDTEERLAAIGLEIRLINPTKLTKDVIYKGPKNLQLQQCKRILLELELGLIQLQHIKPIPRPLRGSKKKIYKPLENSSNLITLTNLPSHHTHEPTTTTPDILTIEPSPSTSQNKDESTSNNVLGKNFENCDPALLGLGPSYSNSTPDSILLLSSSEPQSQSHSQSQSQSGLTSEVDQSIGTTNHHQLVHRYMNSNLHPNNTPLPTNTTNAVPSSSTTTIEEPILDQQVTIDNDHHQTDPSILHHPFSNGNLNHDDAFMDGDEDQTLGLLDHLHHSTHLNLDDHHHEQRSSDDDDHRSHKLGEAENDELRKRKRKRKKTV